MSTHESAHDRLVESAAELFYKRGLTNVGINEVTEQAGVARMTLYNIFGSKEALALAAFERQSLNRRQLIEERMQSAQTPAASIDALFGVSEAFAADPSNRGCPFINVAVQDPNPDGQLHALVRAHKAWIRSKFRLIAETTGHQDPDLVSLQLLVVLDGASMETFIQGSVGPLHAGKQAAYLLLGLPIATNPEAPTGGASTTTPAGARHDDRPV